MMSSTSSVAEQEYIDYSCSTPLERFSRDIETILRKWHVHDNDRHVSSFGDTLSISESFATASTKETVTINSGSKAGVASTPAALSRVGNSFTSISESRPSSGFPPRSGSSNAANANPRLASVETNSNITTTPSGLYTTRTTTSSNYSGYSKKRQPLSSCQQSFTSSVNTNATPACGTSARCLRQRSVTFYPTPNNRSLSLVLRNLSALKNTKFDAALHRGIPLTLTLWDGPPPIPATSNKNLPLSLHRRQDFRGAASSTNINDQNSDNIVISVLPSNTFSATNPFDLSSLLGIGQHITLTPSLSHSLPSSSADATSANINDATSNIMEALLQLHYLPSVTTALNTAISNAGCAIPAFALGSWYDPTIGVGVLPKSKEELMSSQRSLAGSVAGSLSSFRIKKRRSSGAAAAGGGRSISSNSSHPYNIFSDDENALCTIQYAKLLPLPSWLLLGNNTSINSNTIMSDTSNMQSTSKTTMLTGQCLPLDCCSFPTSLQQYNSRPSSNNDVNRSGFGTRGVFHIQILCEDAVPQELKWPAKTESSSLSRDNGMQHAAVSYLMQIFQSQITSVATSSLTKDSNKSIFLSSVVYTYEWDKYNDLFRNKRRIGDNSRDSNGNGATRAALFLRSLSRTLSTATADADSYIQSEVTKTPCVSSCAISWRAACLKDFTASKILDQVQFSYEGKKSNRKSLQPNSSTISILRLIHTYEILAGSASVIVYLSDQVYADVRKRLQPLYESMCNMQQNKYIDEVKNAAVDNDNIHDDDNGEYLFGPSSDPVANVLLHLYWAQQKQDIEAASSSTNSKSDNIIPIPTSISVQCAWDNFVKHPVVINPLSAHVRYVFSAYIFAVTCFTPYATRQDFISPSKRNGVLLLEALTALPFSASESASNNSSGRSKINTNASSCGQHYRAYVGNTTNKLVAAMKVMLTEQLSDHQEDSDDDSELRMRGDAYGSIDPAEYHRILIDVVGIMKDGGLWNDDNSDDACETNQRSLVPYGSPVGRLLSLICFYMSRQSSPRMMMVVWDVLVEEIKRLWEKRLVVSNVGFSIPSELTMPHRSDSREESKHRQHAAQSLFVSRHGTCYGDCRTDVDRECSLLDEKLQLFNIGVAFAREAENTEPIRDIPLSPALHVKNGANPSVGQSTPIIATPQKGISSTGECSDVRSRDNLGDNRRISDPKTRNFFWCCSDSRRKRSSSSNSNNKDIKPCPNTDSFLSPIGTNATNTGSHSPDAIPPKKDTQIEPRNLSSCFSPMSDGNQLWSDGNPADGGKENGVSSNHQTTISDSEPLPSIRRGARYPVQNMFLSSGNQIYAPLLQNKSPVTSDSLLQRRLLARQLKLNQGDASEAIEASMKIHKFFQHPILRSDMEAFKAANPGSVFNDFIRWYGSPKELSENSCKRQIDDTVADDASKTLDEEQVFENALRRHFTRRPSSPEVYEKFLQMDSKMELSLQNFWKETWQNSMPIPAFEQDMKLFDAVQEVEKLLYHLENLSPIQLMNHVLEINFTTAYELLLAMAGDALKVNFIEITFTRLAEKTRSAVMQLKEDSFVFMLNLENPTGSHLTVEKLLLPITLKACESLCNAIGEVELILSRASSLLQKFPGQYELVNELMSRREGEEVHVTSNGRAAQATLFQSIQQGIFSLLKGLSESEKVSCNDKETKPPPEFFPFPSSREFVLRNTEESKPCQLLAQIRGGTTEEEDYACVMALTRCL